MTQKTSIKSLVVFIFLLFPSLIICMDKKEKKVRKRAFTSSSARNLEDLKKNYHELEATVKAHYDDLNNKFVVTGERVKETADKQKRSSDRIALLEGTLKVATSRIKELESDNKKLSEQFAELSVSLVILQREGNMAVKEISRDTHTRPRKNYSPRKKKKKSTSGIYIPKASPRNSTEKTAPSQELAAKIITSDGKQLVWQVRRRRRKKSVLTDSGSIFTAENEEDEPKVDSLKAPLDPSNLIIRKQPHEDTESAVASTLLSPRPPIDPDVEEMLKQRTKIPVISANELQEK